MASRGIQGHDIVPMEILGDNALRRIFEEFLPGCAINPSEFRGQFVVLKQVAENYVSKTVPEILRIREQIKAGVFPIRLKGDEWNSGTNNWLLDIIAPNQQLTTAVIANFGQVVKQGDRKEGNGDIKIHPLITRLVDPEVLKKMGASKDVG